jgi:hypothetical protein
VRALDVSFFTPLHSAPPHSTPPHHTPLRSAQFNRIKDQEDQLAQIRTELQKNKDQLALLRKASSESKNGMNEKLKGFKNMKKQLLQDQGKVMDDLNDRNVSPGPVSLVGGCEGS